MKRIVLMIFVFGALASCLFAQQESEDVVYSNCGFSLPIDVTSACRIYHPDAVGLLGTAGCLHEQCFEMNYGEGVRVKFPKEFGPFPTTYFVWVKEGTLDNTYPGEECALFDHGKKTRVEIPASNPRPRCKVELKLGGFLYHEQFASNPATGCLVWLECREDVVVP